MALGFLELVKNDYPLLSWPFVFKKIEKSLE